VLYKTLEPTLHFRVVEIGEDKPLLDVQVVAEYPAAGVERVF
jgi:hypothetical protein